MSEDYGLWRLEAIGVVDGSEIGAAGGDSVLGEVVRPELAFCVL